MTEEQLDAVEQIQAEAREETEAEVQEEPALEEEAGEQAVDDLTILRQELEEVRAREVEYLDGWQRARAELANARKRFQREREQAYTSAKGDVLARLLPVVDDLERAFETLPRNLSGLTWIEGVALIQRKLQWLLEQDGVEAIEAPGQEFDPYLHQAVTHEPSDTVPLGRVISELQKGYRMGDRVLRPSMVRVSAGPPPAQEDKLETEAVDGAASTQEGTPADENPPAD